MLSKSASWRETIGCRATSPHNTDLDNIPLFAVPGLETATVLTDPMHCFHLGWGVDLAASSVVLLSVLGEFGDGGLDRRMECAFGQFMEHCVAVGATTSCDKFSKEKFDMFQGCMYIETMQTSI